jgi:tRNA U34 5-methylaminomethyl-2-thiouridine-forming methyltransferase MnmC
MRPTMRRKELSPLSVRLSPAERQALSAMAAAAGTTPSVMVRRALKAMGLDVMERPGPGGTYDNRRNLEEVEP